MSLLGVLNPVSLGDEERHSSPEVCIQFYSPLTPKKTCLDGKALQLSVIATYTVGWKKKN